MLNCSSAFSASDCSATGRSSDLAQGYWISRPLPADGLMTWLTDSFWGMKRK
jgi:hypothetical protein